MALEYLDVFDDVYHCYNNNHNKKIIQNFFFPIYIFTYHRSKLKLQRKKKRKKEKKGALLTQNTYELKMV
jgi:hypothetical protein